jgi:hypothetical protein
VSDTFSVIVLAGGRAKRLPGKLQAEIGGTTLLARVVDNLKPLGAEIVLSVDAGFDRSIARGLGVRIVSDTTPERGPAAALATAIEAVATTYFFAVPGDAPFVDSPEPSCSRGAKATKPSSLSKGPRRWDVCTRCPRCTNAPHSREQPEKRSQRKSPRCMPCSGRLRSAEWALPKANVA